VEPGKEPNQGRSRGFVENSRLTGADGPPEPMNAKASMEPGPIP
jgi:hypothetical protein